MFERFDDKARRTVVIAQEEARLLGHKHIGTEHLLLALAHQPGTVAQRALATCGVTFPALRDAIAEAVGGPDDSVPLGHVPFTPRAKRVLELSLSEAMQLKHNYIGAEHILLGLIREGKGVAARVLTARGADPSRVRQAVIQ